MNGKAEVILQKIGFIETDIELQKQIAASIPEGNEDEVREVLEKIVRMKEEVETLKASIEKVDPEAHARIMTLEKATEKFKEIARDKKFAEVITLDHSKECSVRLKDDTVVDCLVAARDEAGDWTVLTLDGETREYRADETA